MSQLDQVDASAGVIGTRRHACLPVYDRMSNVDGRQKNPHAVALAQLGAAKGGAARAKALSPTRLSAIARQAGLARGRALGARRRTEIARRAAAARWSGQLPALLESLFWSHALDELRLPEREDVVFLHVLARGTASQVRWLARRFGNRAIRSWIRARSGWGIGAERLALWIDAAEVRRWWRKDPASRVWTERRFLTAADAPEAVRRLLKSYEPQALLWAHPGHRYVIVSEILARGDGEARAWLWDTMPRPHVIELVRKHHGAGIAEPVRAKLREELGFTTDDLSVRPYLGLS
jgi:hypothetical protein